MASKYENLLGTELTLIDGQLVASPGRPLTESVLVIGPALDGPTDQIVRINNLATAESVYGTIVFNSTYKGPSNETVGYSGNALIKGIREVFLGGCADVRAIRVGGTLASTNLVISGSAVAITGAMAVAARFPGRIYNSAVVTFTSGSTSGKVVITQPAVKGGDVTLVFTDETIPAAIDRINGEIANRSVRLTNTSFLTTTSAKMLHGAVTLTGGTDGTIRDDLATNKATLVTNLTTANTGTFAILEDAEVDIIYLSGIYIDDIAATGQHTSVSTDLAAYLGQRTIDHPIIGVMGTRPLDDFSSRAKINTHYEALTSSSSGFRDSANTWTKAGFFLNNGYTYVDGDLEQSIDAGAYLQVVAADVVLNDRDLGLYVESAAGLCAGALSRLRPHMAASHKQVPGTFSVPYTFTRAQLDSLAGGVGRDINANRVGNGAYVTIRQISGRGTLWTRDVTAATRKSDFRDLQPLRIANAVQKGIKELAFPFLGQPNDLAHRQALTTQIRTFLDGMYDAGALLGRDGVGYILDVRGGDSPLSNLLGRVEIDVLLRPALQIKTIKVRTRLSL